MQRGTYCLIFKLAENLQITVKSGKKFNLPKGNYLYVGSAWGGGGIRARVKRHLKKRKKKHWHLDFITTSRAFSFLKVVVFENQRIECRVASFLSKSYSYVPMFGCSDCNCSSHLFRIDEKVLERLRTEFTDFKELREV